MSQALVKLQRSGQLVIPRLLRQEAGVPEGALMKVDVVNDGQFLVTAQLTDDRAPTSRKSRKELLKELGAAVAELRRNAKVKGLDTMPMAEINRAVTAARRDLKKKSTRPAQK